MDLPTCGRTQECETNGNAIGADDDEDNETKARKRQQQQSWGQALGGKHNTHTHPPLTPCCSPLWLGLFVCWLLNNHQHVIIIIAFKGAIRDFLQSPHSAANCLQHVRSSGPGAIVCKSCATHQVLITCKSHVTCHLVRRDSSAIKFDRVEIAFIWASFYWLNH